MWFGYSCRSFAAILLSNRLTSLPLREPSFKARPVFRILVNPFGSRKESGAEHPELQLWDLRRVYFDVHFCAASSRQPFGDYWGKNMRRRCFWQAMAAV
jgi:hypothetical protein